MQGNFIGTNADGTVRISNGADGIFINDAPGNTIGGTTIDAGNLVSGNGQVGIQIFGLGAQRNLIQSNTLGRTASGAVGAGLLNGGSNDLGIYVNTTPNVNTIVANIGQGVRQSPTGAPFIPPDPGIDSRDQPRRFDARSRSLSAFCPSSIITGPRGGRHPRLEAGCGSAADNRRDDAGRRTLTPTPKPPVELQNELSAERSRPGNRQGVAERQDATLEKLGIETEGHVEHGRSPISVVEVPANCGSEGYSGGSRMSVRPRSRNCPGHCRDRRNSPGPRP